jgi:light-regulated signal transduction histidine kinase (bacteriophytochrome)
MSESELPPNAELARLRAELEATQQQLAAAQSGLADYAYSVSHDLRANLRHITSYVALVREELAEPSNAQLASYMDVVTTAAKGMGQQIDALMRWSQLDRVVLLKTPVNLPALIDEVRQALAGEAAGRQIDWQVATDFPSLRVDGALVRELFIHLLSNALKFTRPRPRAVIEVGWQASTEAGYCLVSIRDNGVGFNQRERDKMFRVFQRLHSHSEFEGLGMGLALASKIVTLHGGSIRVEGEPDAGCQISFTLPLANPS